MNEKCSKVLYQLINSKDIVPKAIQKWKTELSLHLDINDSVKDYFKVCFKTTTDTSIQLLQYRILHRILPTNYYLKKINVISYDVCTFCKENVETIQHVFMTCSEILPIWNNLSMYILKKKKFQIELALMLKMYYFGELPFSSYNKVVNFIINTFLIVQNKTKKLTLLECYIIYHSNIKLKNI